MRSDRDRRSDTEREIDDFLSKFEPPADDISTDISSYLDSPGEKKDRPAEKKEQPKNNQNNGNRNGNNNGKQRSNKKKKRSNNQRSSSNGSNARNDQGSSSADRNNNTDVNPSGNSGKHSGNSNSNKNNKQNNNKQNNNKQNSNRQKNGQKNNNNSGNKNRYKKAKAPAAVSSASRSSSDNAKKEPSSYKAGTASRKRRSYMDTGYYSNESFYAKSGSGSSSKSSAASSKKSDDPSKKKSKEEIEQILKEKTSKEKASKGKASGKNAKTVPDYNKTSYHRSRSGKKPVKATRTQQPSKAVQKASDKKKQIRRSAAALRQAQRKNGKKLSQVLFLKENPDFDPNREVGAKFEKDGKTVKNKKFKFSWLKLLRDLVIMGAAMVLCGIIVAAGFIISAPKYNYKDIYSAVDTSSIIYDDEGKQVDNVFYTENRKIVKYEDMPEDLINSFIAIEDKTFWTHHGFNWTRMIGAVLSSITGHGKISGTSTITQQLARNVYLADTKSVRSIKRKILEMYYANRLESNLTKEEIIEAYLNTIYLGHGCYGVNAAAKTYFNKKVKNMDLVECASLAALPQSPDTYALLKLASEAQDVVDSKVVATEPESVVTNDLSKERRQLTLDLMLDQGFISQADHDKVYNLALNDFIDPNLKSSSSDYSYFHEYLVDTVINDLMSKFDMSYDEAERMVYTKGLKIYSTVDSTAQKIIAKEFQDGSNFPYVTAPKDADGNLLNNDGQIMLYKYDNFFDEDGDFKLSGTDGDVKVNSDGSITIMKDHKLHIYETEVEDGTDYSLEFKKYYYYDDDDILYSIAGGYLNVPAGYKSADSSGNVIIDKAFFEDPYYEGCIKIDGDDVILTEKSYTLSTKSRQPQAAMTIVGVGTGEVKAMVGGRQFGGQKMLNRSLNARQPGSSIKPLSVYGAALQKSFELQAAGQKWKYTNYGIDRQGIKGYGDYITMHSSVEDERTKINGKYWPNNFNNSFSGHNTFKTAIQKSINTCAVKILLQVGADFSIQQLQKFGLSTVQADTSQQVNDANPAALALGAMTEGVMPLEMALAYASFPAGGKLNTPVCYYKVLDRDGDVLLESKSEQSEVMNEGVAWIMQEVLKSVVQFNRYMYVSDVQPGGKTGTTNDQYDIWFDGFTPSYAASIWIGTDENVEMSSMSTPAAALWGKIINQIPNAKKGSYAAMPSNVIQKGGEYFTRGTETGLSSYNDKEAREKARKAAYNKWLKEREKHKKQVCDNVCTGGELIGYQKKTETYTEYIHHPAEYKTEKYIDPEDGIEKERQVLVKDAWDEPVEKTRQVDDTSKPIYSEKKCGQQCRTEYEPGYRDGDFKFKYN